jgi:4-aminobutyrate aminotransferase-like enzyme
MHQTDESTRIGGAVVAHRSAELQRSERDHLYCLMHYYEDPVVMDHALGAWVTDVDGRRYLDFFSGILTTSLGHCHPRLVDRIRDQAGRLGHTSTLYVTEAQIDAARRLGEIAPGRLSHSFFTNSGTEAIETAITLARIATGRHEVVALRQAYHGRSSLATALTAHAGWRPLASSVTGITHTLSPDPYRCPFRQPCDETCVDRLAEDLVQVIETTTNGQPAALIAETIQGVGGYVVPPDGYFQRMAEVIRSYGGLLIIDEVQAGFGRTGTHWFGIEHWGVEPDIMVMAKGIAGGMPVAATITRPEIARRWTGKTISTFGGNPICMAAMAETLQVMAEEDVPANAAARGEQLRQGLQALGREHAWIGDIRGMGLMQAMDLVEDPVTKEPSPAKAKALMEATRDQGLLLGLGGLHGHVVRIGPYLLVTEAEVDDALGRLARACAAIDA